MEQDSGISFKAKGRWGAVPMFLMQFQADIQVVGWSGQDHVLALGAAYRRIGSGFWKDIRRSRANSIDQMFRLKWRKRKGSVYLRDGKGSSKELNQGLMEWILHL